MNKTDVNILRNAVVALKILALSSDDTFLEDLAERAENIVNGIETEQTPKSLPDLDEPLDLEDSEWIGDMGDV